MALIMLGTLSRKHYKTQLYIISNVILSNCSFCILLYKSLISLSIGKEIACLLYTSDAADDMQCVDLGGRRIIKKFSLL